MSESEKHILKFNSESTILYRDGYWKCLGCGLRFRSAADAAAVECYREGPEKELIERVEDITRRTEDLLDKKA